MNKYWMIGTGASTYLNKFITLVDTGITTGEAIHLIETENNYEVTLSNGNVVMDFNSKSTARQYFEVWIALGFLLKLNNKFRINTNLNSYDELAILSKIYITKESSDLRTQRYRNTILINILVTSNVINENDISKKEIRTVRGFLGIDTINKLISKYEKEISWDKKYVRKLKEKYDKQF
ncbi:hypothetical protein [Candidatus Mycoplasma mahonii]|uniref:hypothetical protein n=1 Tax=Candidatus Mycoplasma mahonii TaxID=3004105 RepID=UPI0026EA0AC8|nr:hypothetical protein [Candidatus Mycoplasma mahonii]WKX02771.1 hypothetical protein O3I44_01715 [Candidatus Mycoplasma mahonii]